MLILKIIHGYPPKYNAGSEVYSQSVCNELSKHHSVSIFTREENPYLPDFSIRKELLHESVTVYFLNIPRGKDGFRHEEVDKQFRIFLHKLNPDVAHIGHLNHLSTGIIDVLHEQNIPIVFTLHDFWLMCPRGQFLQTNFGSDEFYQLCSGQGNEKCADKCYRSHFTGLNERDDLNYWTKWVATRMAETRSICGKVDVFISPSKYLLNRFISEFGISESKMIYLDYGFPTHYLQPVSMRKKSRFTFGYIGTHIPAKGIHLLIEAFGKLEGKTELMIWGRENNPSTSALIAMAEKAKCPVTFKGEYINKNLATEVFSNVDCIVVPSIWAENSPLVIHEAQACRVPMITADAGGMAEYVQHGVNGLLFKHRNVEDLTKKMRYAIDHPEQMLELGKRGYLYSQDGSIPAIETHCAALEDIYKQIIELKCKDKVSGELR